MIEIKDYHSWEWNPTRNQNVKKVRGGMLVFLPVRADGLEFHEFQCWIKQHGLRMYWRMNKKNGRVFILH